MTNTVHQTPTKDFWTISPNLKDANWHIPLNKHYREFMACQVGHHLWQFWEIFGLIIAPKEFTLLISVLRQLLLSQRNDQLLAYLENFLIMVPAKVYSANTPIALNF